MKYNIYLLVFLTLVYFIPAFIFISNAYKQLEVHMTPEDNPVALRSIGAFMRFAGDVEFTQKLGACYVYPDAKFTNDYSVNRGACAIVDGKKKTAAKLTANAAAKT